MTLYYNNEGSLIITEMVSDMFGNEIFYDQVFQGYTKKEAISRFKKQLKEEGFKPV